MITLSNVMKANAMSCIVFGIIFFLLPEEVSMFLSTDMQAPSIVLSTIGAGLFFNGLHLIWASYKVAPSKFLVLYFSINDYIWVFGTTFLLFAGIWISTPVGILATLLVSVIVGTFGVLQMSKRNEMGNY